MSKKSPIMSPRETVSRRPVNSSTEPTDRLGFYVICFIGIVGSALVCQIQFSYAPTIWSHLVIALPPVLLASLLFIWLLKGLQALSRSRFETEEKQNEAPAHSSGVLKQAA